MSEQPLRRSPLHRVGLSTTQLVASALAAVTATAIASYLGVAGTVIGAAVASILSVLGNAIYSHSLLHTGNRVRAAAPVRGRWLIAACTAMFVGVIGVVTVVELAAGRPLNHIVHDSPGSGTTVFGGPVHPQAHGVVAPVPTPTVTVTAHVVTVTPTVTAPPTTSTAATSSPSEPTTPSATPTATPSDPPPAIPSLP